MLQSSSSHPKRLAPRFISNKTILYMLVFIASLEAYRIVFPKTDLKDTPIDLGKKQGLVVKEVVHVSGPVPTRISDRDEEIPNIKIPLRLQTAIENNNPNREIVLVHVGKTGGSSVRDNVAAKCYGKWAGGNEATNHPRLEKCLARFLFQQKLANQTRRVVHMHDMPQPIIEQATTFLISLRNPVDRIHSAYRYTHPANCQRSNGNKNPENYGCWSLDHGRLEPGMPAYKMWKECFPSPAMEAFAQAILPPWNPNPHWMAQNFTSAQQLECRKTARQLVQGGSHNQQMSPHMEYNYNYYARATFQKHPTKEIFALRMEQQYKDMVQLDVAMGGRGQLRRPNHRVSHGSEHYLPSILTPEATHKLCCVLEEELQIYLDIYNRALNLDEADSAEASQWLRKQCGLDPSHPTWSKWRTACKEKLQEAIE